MVKFVQYNDAKRLLLLSMMPKNAKCAEIGVWKGGFSRTILSHTNPAELHLIDPWAFRPEWPERIYGGRIAKSQDDMDQLHAYVLNSVGKEQAVTVHRKRSIDCASMFPDGHFDWIYLDGDHSYDGLKADLEAWKQKVRDGGFLTGDDFDWKEPDGQESVKNAVVDFADNNDITQVNLIETQFVIQLQSQPDQESD